MTERSSIFDLIGPVMIGPSSSHTAGVARIGKFAHDLFGAIPQHAVVTFYNSFAHTYEGHGSDRAIISGLLGFMPDDDRLRESLQLAAAQALTYEFKAVASNPRLHPNSLRVEIMRDNRKLDLIGISRGGGIITIREVNGFHANLSGSLTTLAITAEDTKGSIAFISDVIAHDDVNIATMSVGRTARNHTAMLIIELDSDPRPITLQYLKSLRWVQEVLCVLQPREVA
jgi:L-serine dehydratase